MSIFTAARRGLNALTSNDSNLANLLSEEKDTVAALTALKTSYAASSTYLQLWGENESEDLKDISSSFDTILKDYGMAFVELEDSHNKYRERLKDISTMTDSLAAVKAKIKACKDRLEKAIKQNKNAESIQAELGGLELQLQDETAGFENEKRRILKEAMMIHYAGIIRFSQKAMVVGEFGTYLAKQIPQTNVKSGQDIPPFIAQDITRQIVQDFEAELYVASKKELPASHDYHVPIVLNLDKASISSPSQKTVPTPTAAATSSFSSPHQKDLLWDADFETSNQLAAPTLVAESHNNKRPVPLLPASSSAATANSGGGSVGWTAFGSTDAGVPVSNTSSSSSLHQLPSDFADNPW